MSGPHPVGRAKKHRMRQRRRWGILGWPPKRVLTFHLKRIYSRPFASVIEAESVVNFLLPPDTP